MIVSLININNCHYIHLFYQILCMAKMHAWYSVGPRGSLNIALKLYIFGIRYDNSVVRRGPIRTLIYDEAYCLTRDKYLKNVEFSHVRMQLCLIKLASVLSICILCLDIYISWKGNYYSLRENVILIRNTL